jgi:methylase of polypeptide subunit release factors
MRVNQRGQNAMARDIGDIFGWSRPFDPGLLPADLFRSLRDGGIIVPEGSVWRSRVRVSTLDGDAFLHSAFPTSAADAVFFGPDTYRFARAIQGHLRRNSSSFARAVDLGTGAGVGGMLIARSGLCEHVTLTDINPEALRFARLNAMAAGLRDLSFVRSDLFGEVAGSFDLIVANPPYLNDSLRRAYRHGGGDHGSALSLAIAGAASTRLAPGGALLLYTGAPIVRGRDRLLEAIRGQFEGQPLQWTYEEIDPDVFGEELDTPAYADVERIAAVLLTVIMPGERPC